MNSSKRAATFLVASVIGMGLAVTMFLPSTRRQSEAALPTPDTMHVPGVVRDFHANHPDFDVVPAEGAGHYVSMVPVRLPAPGALPTFTGSGRKVLASATDVRGHKIAPHLIVRHVIGWAGGEPCDDPLNGDVAARLDPNPSTVAVTSEATFDEWFSDVLGTNTSAAFDIVFIQQADDTFVFDNDLDPRFADAGGFYPIDDRLFGNEGQPHNLHFTLHFQARFTYQPGQFFSYLGNSDVWVYVGDRLGLDVGGVHGKIDQRLDIDRLCLQPGAQYWLTFNLAHRSGPDSELRIETNIEFEGTGLAAVTGQNH